MTTSRIWFPVIKTGSGAEVFTLRLAAALKRHGAEAVVTRFASGYELWPSLLKSAPMPAGTAVIHANAWNGFAFARPGAKLVVTEHHCVFDSGFRRHKTWAQHLYHTRFVKTFERRSLSAAARVTAVSEYTASSLAAALGVRPHTVIHNWIDIARYQPDRASKRGNRPFRLLFVGNLSRRKGADLLAPIMKRLGSGFELRFTAGLRARKRGIGLSDNMTALGSLDEEGLIRAYQECDALLFPSRFEGFGYAPLEAMACGKPVITANNSALPEVVIDGETGILCDTDDIDAFVDACRRLREDSGLCARLGEAGRSRAEEHFSENVILPRYLALYEDALSLASD